MLTGWRSLNQWPSIFTSPPHIHYLPKKFCFLFPPHRQPLNEIFVLESISRVINILCCSFSDLKLCFRNGEKKKSTFFSRRDHTTYFFKVWSTYNTSIFSFSFSDSSWQLSYASIHFLQAIEAVFVNNIPIGNEQGCSAHLPICHSDSKRQQQGIMFSY